MRCAQPGATLPCLLAKRFPHLGGDDAAKDAFHEHLIGGAQLPAIERGTKAAFHRRLEIPANGTETIRLRFYAATAAHGDDTDAVIATRRTED